MLKIFRLAVFAASLTSPAYAAQYDCPVSQKFDGENEYSAKYISDAKFSVKIIDDVATPFLYRCSFASSENKVTCDKYRIDKIAYDTTAKIKKFYVFDSQFDVQVFSNLLFVENNGRGTIAYGKCKVTSP